jgi:hypothetical protein
MASPKLITLNFKFYGKNLALFAANPSIDPHFSIVDNFSNFEKLTMVDLDKDPPPP